MRSRRRIARAASLAGLLLAGAGAAAADEPPAAEERSIRAEVVVPAPRAEVWSAWTTAEGLTSFFGRAAHVELRHGGPFEVYFLPDAAYGSRGSEGCRVLAWIENEMLAFSWNAPPPLVEARTRRTFVVLRFDDEGPGRTRVRLVNDGYAADEVGRDAQAYFAKAWPAVLESLRRRFAEGPQRDGVVGHLPPPERRHFLVTIHPTREGMIDAPTEEESRIVGEHARYIRGLIAESRAILAGPSFGPSLFPVGAGTVPFDTPPGGIVILLAEDETEAQQLLSNDPAIKMGVFAGRVNPFVLSFLAP